MAIFLKALMAGLAISVPIGPINVVCIKQTVRLGLSGFLVVAMASGLANIVLSGLAATGSVAIVHYLTHYQKFLNLFGLPDNMQHNEKNKEQENELVYLRTKLHAGQRLFDA